MTHRQGLEWRDIGAPVVKLREPGQDGLELHVRQATVPLEGFYGSYALGVVVTVSSGSSEQHENVLLSAKEPTVLARWLHAALKSPRRARLLSTFDDGMTLRIQGEGQDSWTVECRPVPLPGPNDTWKTFPHFSFGLTAASIQRAISELEALARVLPPMELPKAARTGDAASSIRRLRRGVFVLVGIAALTMGTYFAWTGVDRPRKWLIPAEYRGWVLVHYLDPSCSELPAEGIFVIVSVSASGRVCTSSAPSSGWTYHRFEYVRSDGGTVEIPSTPSREDSVEIRQHSAGGWSSVDARPREAFFVGTVADLRGPAGAPPVD